MAESCCQNSPDESPTVEPGSVPSTESGLRTLKPDRPAPIRHAVGAGNVDEVDRCRDDIAADDRGVTRIAVSIRRFDGSAGTNTRMLSTAHHQSFSAKSSPKVSVMFVDDPLYCRSLLDRFVVRRAVESSGMWSGRNPRSRR